MRSHAIFALLLLLAPIAPAFANDEIYRVPGPPGFPYFFCRLQDIDGDGLPDFITAARSWPSGSELRFWSGVDGTLIRSILDPSHSFGGFGDAGDVDGDGASDWIAVSYDLVRVGSGRTGATIYEFSPPLEHHVYGAAIAGIGDVDGDGVPDFAIGDPQIAWFGHGWGVGHERGFVEVRSGADGSLIRTLHGGGTTIAFGGSICSVEDVDGDGVRDLAVAGYIDRLPAGPTTTTLFSGATGARLWVVRNSGILADVGDVDHDGRGDLVRGMPWRSRVEALSGADGSILWTRPAPPQGGEYPADHFGQSVASAGDLDGDGIADVIVGAPQPALSGAPGDLRVGPGYAEVLSGATGELLFTLVGTSSQNASTLFGGFGGLVAGMGDADHDGLPDLLVCDRSLSSLTLLSGDRRNSTPNSYCVPDENSVHTEARIAWSGTYSVAANALDLEAHGAKPSTSGIFFASTGASALRITVSEPFGFKGFGYECLGDPPHFRAAPVVETDSSGSARVRFDPRRLPPGSVVPGSTWNFQFVYRDLPGTLPGTNRSDALSVTFRP